MGGSQLRFRWGRQSTIPFCSSGRGGVGCAGCPGVGLQTQAHQQQPSAGLAPTLCFGSSSSSVLAWPASLRTGLRSGDEPHSVGPRAT